MHSVSPAGFPCCWPDSVFDHHHHHHHQQQQVNRALIQENHMLWSTVPLNEIFSTIRAPSSPTHSFINIDAFKEKIDLANIQLNWTDSPHLEAARVEEEEFQKRWDEMNFIAGGEKSV